MIVKIISGGQTGADRGGLIAGQLLGIETGGTAPKNYMTDIGPDLSLKDFGLDEGPYDPKIYPIRTRMNVIASDGTLLVGNTSSPGSRLTLRYCLELNKPIIINPIGYQLGTFLVKNGIKILNVAGNRERTNPGIQKRTINLLLATLEKL